MTVLFKTHETSYGQSGSKAIRFSFKWESVTGGASECGNELKGNHGTVSSPGYPTNYPANAQCTWSISLGEDAKYNDHIVLSFKVTKGPTQPKINRVLRISMLNKLQLVITIFSKSITLLKQAKL